MARAIALADLRVSDHAAVFRGKDHGSGVSFFVTTHLRGEGPKLHRHPYDETFLLERGSATFTVGGETVDAHAGQLVVVPPGTPHAFTSTSDEPLQLISIHPAPEMQTEWLE